MKRRTILTFSLLLFCTIYLFAQQVPDRINYQTILRNLSTGVPLSNTTVALRFTLLQDDVNGSQIYKEQHLGKTTNQFGLVTVSIGSGEALFGNFSQIDWNTGTKFIRVEVDVTNSGNNWQLFTTSQLISVPYAFVAQSANTLADLNAQTGQILKWNGTAWQPGPDVSGTDNWGTQVVQTTGVLAGNGTAALPLTIAQQNATSGQVLKWSGTAWLPGPDNVSGGGDNWGTQVTQTSAALSGNGTAASPLTIAQQNATSGQVLKWNGTAWQPGPDTGTPDNWGNQVAQTSAALAGNGTSASPLTIAQQNAASGEVLKWNGTAWIPGPDLGMPDNWGNQVAQTAAALAGNGTAASPLTIAQQNAQTGQVLKWSGTAWLPGDIVSTGDNWGTQVAQTSTALSGNGTAASPLTIAQQNAQTGQVLKWSGTAWLPGDVVSTGDNWGTQVAQTSAVLSGNGTAASPLSIAQQSASNGQVLKWNGTSWSPANDITGADNWGTQTVQTTAVLSGNGTVATPLTLAQQSAATGQVLKWNGASWSPANDNNTGPDNWGNQVVETGLSITGFGTIGNPLILAQQNATTGQVLKWNGSAWVPGTDNTSSGGASQWLNTGTKIYYNTNNVGIGINDPQYKLHSVTGTAGGSAVVGDGTTLSNFGIGVTGISFGSNAIPTSSDIGVFGSGSTGVFGSGSTGVFGSGGTGVAGVSNLANTGVYGETNGGSGGFVGAVFGAAYGSSDYGVVGVADASGSYGVYGRSETGMGVVGYTNGSSKYGVWGFSNNATSFAGYFTGKVTVTGMLSKGGGTFQIDHPLDPANKYLYHSFVESPDMMNVYNGNTVTDQQGWATVQLPEYFEALNKDFRYQLTCVGDFAQVIVGEKIKNNQFKIRTDKPGIEVSWQVTGIRKDPFAEANRVVPEVEKTGSEKGRFIHPEFYGQPASSAIGGMVQKPRNKPILPSDKKN